MELCTEMMQAKQWQWWVLLVWQAAQQVMELQEAAQINQGLQTANVGRDTSVHDMKAIVKTWR